MAALCVESDVCKETLIARLKELQDECTALLSSCQDVKEIQIAQRSLVTCQSSLATLQISQGKINQDTLANILNNFTKSVMDKTYVEECRLVNDEFKDNDSKQNILKIIDQLSEPEDIVKQFLPSLENVKIEQLLGQDVQECLWWRKGALFYMYCNTIYSNNKAQTDVTTDFIKDCELGVEFLQKMLNVRTLERHMDIRDDSTAQLFMQGIFSDTHLLALMYAGELCYWHWKTLTSDHKREAIQRISTSGDTSSPLDSISLGKRFLQRYIRTVKGPLKNVGWDSIKAEQYLDEFNNVLELAEFHG